eukprot:TRINITY_DN213_c0_g1_i1.p1 TRINITY_DN213_c0_g1~~TRINITY_DN213_c0_g1_i1.p1  ORF type:complete len:581 (-),score=212.92 TRINITY_DN213_c0_g1_i1:380-2122(-)
MANPGEIDALELLKQDLADDDIENVVTSMNRLLTVALAIGPQRTREELVPFLQDFDDSNEEALTAVARQLGDLSEFVGGAEHMHILLPALEKLASAEETVIREAAVQSACKVLARLPLDEVAEKGLPVLRRLSSGDWFTSRISSCGLLPTIYPRLPAALQDEVRNRYLSLSRDETPMVRKALFAITAAFIPCLSKPYVRSDVLPALKSLSEDGSDIARVSLVDSLPPLAQMFPAEEYKEVTLPLVEAVCEDASWRVRARAAKSMEQLSEMSGGFITAQYLLPLYVKFFRDMEPEVRSAAVSSLPGVCRSTDPSAIRQSLLGILPSLVTDMSSNVREAFSESLIDITPILGKDTTMQYLTPLIMRLLKDDDANVRLNIISKVDVLGGVIGAELLVETVVPAVREMANDLKWRVRLSVMEKLSHLAKQLGSAFFDHELRDVIDAGLADHVYAVRTSTCEQIRDLVEAFGVEWAIKKLLPGTFSLYDRSSHYLHRMVPLHIIMNVASLLSADIISEHVLTVVIKAAKDNVSNVRLCAAKTFGCLIPSMDKPTVNHRIKPLLLEMKTDPDGDVQYFAGQSLLLC